MSKRGEIVEITGELKIEGDGDIRISDGATGSNPSHYNSLGLEPIDYIRANFSKEKMEGLFEGNVIKYISRYKSKNGVEDLIKCRTYLNWLIDLQYNDDN